MGDKRYELSNHLGNVLNVITDRKLVGGNSTVTPKYTYPFDTTMEGWTNNNTSQPTPVNDGGRIKVTGNVNSIGIKRDVVLSLPGTYLFTVEVDKTAFTPNVSLWLTTSNEVLIHSSLVSGLGKKYITTAVTLDGSGTATYKLIVRRTTGTAATTENPQTFYIDNVTVSEITNTLTAGLQPDVVEYHDYDPFGMLINQRNKSESGGYRYGFQGQEEDNEIKGEGNSLNYTFRMHDPRVGRFLSLDPLALKYPYNSPYAFAENRVIDCIELEGMEAVPIHVQYILGKNGAYGKTTQQVINGVELGAKNLVSPKWWGNVISNAVEDVCLLKTNPAALVKKISDNSLELTRLWLSDNTTGKAQFVTEVIGSALILRGALKATSIARGSIPRTSSAPIAEVPVNTATRAVTPISSNIYELAFEIEYEGGKTSVGETILNNGILELDLSVPHELQGKGIGKSMFDQSLKYFGTGVKKIQGLWTDGTNLELYNKLIESGSSKEEAAFGTVTGKWAKENGFDKVEIIQEQKMKNGKAASVKVHFSKSKT